MFNTLKNAFKIADLRKKIIYTLIMIVIIRLGANIPVPGVDSEFIKELFSKSEGFGIIDAISGGALKNMTIFAMGIIPYINASIIVQLLTVAIPKLEKMVKEDEQGRKKINQYTRYGALVLALIQSAGITFGLKMHHILKNPSMMSYIVAIVSLTAGTAILMWIGEKITERGIGNGISLIIFVNILSRFPDAVRLLADTKEILKVAGLVIGFALVIAFVVLVQEGERRIAVQYAQRAAVAQGYSGRPASIPLKVNLSGVMPIIFAMSILQFPTVIAQFFKPTGTWAEVMRWISMRHPFGITVYIAFIFFFAYFYSTIAFNPIEFADNMKKSGGGIPGIRPGKPTVDYISKILNYITLVGAIFLAIIALQPVIFSKLFAMDIQFGATSLLIAVGVALETVKQIEANMLVRNYKGFLS